MIIDLEKLPERSRSIITSLVCGDEATRDSFLIAIRDLPEDSGLYKRGLRTEIGNCVFAQTRQQIIDYINDLANSFRLSKITELNMRTIALSEVKAIVDMHVSGNTADKIVDEINMMIIDTNKQIENIQIGVGHDAPECSTENKAG